MEQTTNQEFLMKLTKLKPVEVCGIARLLGVELYEDEENKIAREFYDLLGDIIKAYSSLPRRQRRTLLKNIHAVDT